METNPLPADSVNRVLSYDDNGSAPGAFPNNPFVGLRPFRSDEGLLFFGRREQTLELLQQLQQSRFLSVVGSSGCGKSSLIRAGLIPKLEAGFLVEQRDQWRIASAKPGDAPLNNLAQSLIKTFADTRDGVDVATFVEDMRTVCAQAVVDFLTPRLKESDANLLLLVDQFEELFNFGRYGQREITDTEDTQSKETQLTERLERERRRDEAADFVSILLGLAAQSDLPIYVVMTMRSDFLGDCDVFYGLPEAINISQYLVPRLARPQRQEAIESPIVLYGQTISPRLLDRILNDAGEEGDQLPVMQHAMMRTWEKWRATKDPMIDLPHYEAAGTMKQALSNDADEALSGMSAEDRTITKKLFQALTDTDSRGRRIRRPTHLKEIQAITGASREKLLEIISHFSGHGRSFLHLSQEESDPLVDISHESLIRQWATLRDWVTKESRSKEIYLRLIGTAGRYYKPEREDEPLRGAALQLALEWKEKRKPNQAWANRYHPSLDQALRFLDESKAERDRELVEAEKRRNEAAERERRDLEQAQILAQQKQELAEADALARKRELDQALELATQREAAARWQRRAIYGLAFLLLLATATTVWAVTAGYKSRKRKAEAELARTAAEDSAGRLALSLENEKKLKDQISGNLQRETGLKDEAIRLKNDAIKLKNEADTLRDKAVKLAARANAQARIATASAQRENKALIEAKRAKESAQAAAAAAEENAQKARQAEIKAFSTQAANVKFREGLTLRRTNNSTAAAKEYNEAVTLYQSLPEPDLDGEATAYLELADMYLQSEDPDMLAKGMELLEKAENIFKEIKNDNGSAAVFLRTGDFVMSDGSFADTGSNDTHLLSSLLYREAFDAYEKSKNIPGMAATAEKLDSANRTWNEPSNLEILIETYTKLLPYYTERNVAQERASVYLKLGEFYRRAKDPDEANKNFAHAIYVFSNYDDAEAKEAAAKTYVDVGFVIGENTLIKSYIDEGLKVIRQTNDPIAEGNTLRYAGNKTHKRWSQGPTSRPGYADEPKLAIEYYNQALAAYQRAPDSKKNQAETLTDLGMISLQINKTAALDYFQRAYDLYTEKEDRQRANLLYNIGLMQEGKGELEAALKSYQGADAIYSKLDVFEGLRNDGAIQRVRAAIDKRTPRP
jgi:conflict system STAND superfamily ATPase/tetratricopeptide repeat protein